MVEDESVAISDADKDEQVVSRVREWVRTRATSKWMPGYSGDFRRGYDAAYAEVASLIGENVEP